MIANMFELLASRWDFFAGLLWEHLLISLTAIAIAIVIGGVAGILISEFTRSAKPTLAVINFLYTIPSISMLGFLIPFSGVGNATAVAEFNFWHDPEAAAITLTSGVPLIMYGLDVFNEVAVTGSELQALRAGDSPIARAVAHLVGHETAIDGAHGSAPYTLIGDAGAVCLLVAPELFTCETWPVEVELAPGMGRGQSYVDRRPRELGTRAEGWPEVQVAMEVDSRAAADLFLRTVVTDR